MKKKPNIVTTIAILAGVLILVIVLKAAGLMSFNSGVRLGFAGSSTLHSFTGKYAKLMGSTSHVLSPSKDSTGLHCEIHTESGSVTVLITDKKDGSVIFEKEISGDEVFDVPATSKVKVKVSTTGHKGSYSFKY